MPPGASAKPWSPCGERGVYTGAMTSRREAVGPTACRPCRQRRHAERTVEAERRRQPVLSDAQVVRRCSRRRIEAYFGRPQDIEWCLREEFTSSKPADHHAVPGSVADDGENHVYVSVGHQQMMTDAMKPPASLWQLTTRGRWRRPAGGCSSTSPRPCRTDESREHPGALAGTIR